MYTYTYNIQNLGVISFCVLCLFQVVFWMDPFPLWSTAFWISLSFYSLMLAFPQPPNLFVFVCFYGSFLCMVGIWGWYSVAFGLCPHFALLYLLIHFLSFWYLWTCGQFYEGYFRNSPLDSHCLFHSDILIFLSCKCQVDTRDMVTLISPKHSFLPLLISLWLISLV